MPTLDRLIYADDSGDDKFGWIVYGWVECTPDGWRPGLRQWLEFRKKLWRDRMIPPAQELHATAYVNGRGRISTDPAVTLWKDFGREVALECLQVLRDCSDIRIGAVYRQTTAKGSDYYREKADVYAQLVARWDQEQAAANSFALVGMDGDGTDPAYFDAHRALKLDTRHILEDPMFHDSKRSQWTQMADLVAYTAYAHLDRHPKNTFAWSWYEDFLAEADPAGQPRPI